MKPTACSLIVLFAIGFTRAPGPGTDQLAKDALAVLKEQRDLLKKVTDRKSAEAVFAKWQKLDERHKKVLKAMKKLSPDEETAFKKKHPELEPAFKALEKESARVEPFFKELRKAQERTARLGIRNIETAVLAYKLANGDYPQDLTALTEKQGGKPAYLDSSNLKDPWGRPYVYKPKIRNIRTGKPYLFSHGADPTDEKARISNFIP